MSPSRDREDPRARDARDVPGAVRLTPRTAGRRSGGPGTGARGIPEATVARLPVYLRALVALAERGIRTCSSEELASAAGVNSSKLRKDLSYLGSYGTRGVGYDVEYLRYQIAREIGVTQDLPRGHRRHRQPGPRARELLRLLLARVPHRRAARQRPEPGRRGVGALPIARLRRARGDRGRSSRSRSASSPPPPPRRRRSATGSSPPASPASSTSRRRCSRCPTASTSARSTCRSSCRSSPTTSSARRWRARCAGAIDELGDVHEVHDMATDRPAVGRERPRRRGLPPHRPGRAARAARLDADGVEKLIQAVHGTDHVQEATVLATCNRIEIYTDVDRFHGSVEAICRALCDLAERAGRRRRAAPLRALRRRRGLPPLPRRRRARLDGRRRGPDPRPGPRGAAPRPGARHRRARAQRRLPAGAARRQADPRRDRHRPGRARRWCRSRSTAPRSTSVRWPARAPSSSAPARWPRSPSPPCPASGSPRSWSSTAPRPRRAGSPTAVRRPRGRPGRARRRARRRRRGGVLHRRGRHRAHRRRGRSGRSRPGARPLAVVDLALPHDVEPGVGGCPASTWSTWSGWPS